MPPGSATFGLSKAALNYIFVIVKLPEPVQPVPPVRVHVPVIVLPFTVPDRASVLPAGVTDCTVIPNLPATFPLKFPLRVNEPVSVSPETKQVEFVVKLKLVIFSESSLFTASAVPKLKTVALLVSVSVAFHVPFMLAGLELFEPQPSNSPCRGIRFVQQTDRQIQLSRRVDGRLPTAVSSFEK